MQEQNNVTNSLAHTKWNCKYHIVFAPKYTRQVIHKNKTETPGGYLRERGYGGDKYCVGKYHIRSFSKRPQRQKCMRKEIYPTTEPQKQNQGKVMHHFPLVNHI